MPPLAITNCTIDGVDAFNTNDLFSQHPTNPNLWKIHGRVDDQITHSIGEKVSFVAYVIRPSNTYVFTKTNPGPLGTSDSYEIAAVIVLTVCRPSEALLNLDTHIAHCLMFGRGQFNAGVLVEPKAESKFDPQDTKKLAEFRNIIWYVQRCYGGRIWLEIVGSVFS